MPSILYSGGLGNQLLQLSAHFFIKENLSANARPKTFWFGLNKGQYREFLLPSLLDSQQLYRLGFTKKHLTHYPSPNLVGQPIRACFRHIYYYLWNLLATDTSLASRLSFSTLPNFALAYKGAWHTCDFLSQLVFNTLPGILSESTKFNLLLQSATDIYDFDQTACLHMRFGDYVGSTRYAQLSHTTYYTDALNILRKCSDISQFLVVSDDIDRSKSFASTYLPDDSVRFISSTSPLTDFAILSSSKYLVTANSTFH